jgi:hypothetical protein
MEKQSGGEFASTDAAAGAQDAALQELWLSAEIPVEPCSRLQHLQRPTPSHLGSDTPDATRRGDENMARGRGSDVRIPVANGSTTLASPQRDNTPAPPQCDCGHSAWPRRAPRPRGPAAGRPRLARTGWRQTPQLRVIVSSTPSGALRPPISSTEICPAHFLPSRHPTVPRVQSA